MPNHSFGEEELVDEMSWRCLHHRKEKLSRFHRAMELASRGPSTRGPPATNRSVLCHGQ